MLINKATDRLLKSANVDKIRLDITFPGVKQILNLFVLAARRNQSVSVFTELTSGVINMKIKRMLENKVHLLDVSYVSTYIFTEVTVRNKTNN